MINSTNTLRVSGLASGMNTDEIVDSLVKAQSARLNKMQQTKILTTWKSDAYRDVNKKIDEFRKAMEGLRLQSTFNKQAVTSSHAGVEVSSAGTSTQTGFTISEAVAPKAAKPAMVSFDSKITSGSAKLGEEIKFVLNNREITLSSEMTYDQAISRINDLSVETNVRAANVGGSLVLTSMAPGKDYKIDIEFSSGEDKFGAINRSNGSDAEPGKVKINGTEIAIASNKFVYNGVSFNIKEDIPANSNVSIKVSSDTQGIFDSIKTFVDKYNELISDYNGKLNEKRYRDYPPLLESQKKDMKENDIKLWEEKAKSGLLTRDSTIQSFLYEMRNSLVTSIENSEISAGFKSLKDIGISFSSDYSENGKLILDEAKLKGILQTNLEDVKKLFTIKGTGEKDSSTTATDRNMHQNSGFGWRIYDRLNVAISELGNLAGSPNSSVDTKSNIAKQLKMLDSNIYREQEKINSYEKRLWRQFTAMEKSLQQLNSQGSWLSQQLNM
ncbi:flagellar filament capping protein FliD [Pseudoneobacillus sp. C159]